MSLAARQRLFVRYFADLAFEAQVRIRPDEVAEEEGVDPAFVRWLAGLDPRRVRAFRASQVLKEARRRGPGR